MGQGGQKENLRVLKMRACAAVLKMTLLLLNLLCAAATVRVSLLPTLGAPQLVFPGGTSPGSCDPWDLPDAPARAWRDANKIVHLAASWATSRFGTGPTLSGAKHTCAVVYNSTFSGENSLYEDHEWILAPYALDDGSVFALAHQEYHGWEHKNCSVPPSQLVQDCWMVALTLFTSPDGGFTFRHAAPAPDHLVANAPYPYVPDRSGFGYGDPSGIVFHDGFFYVFMHSRQNHSAVAAGTVLMRSANLSDPRSWSCWNGTNFGVVFVDPYEVPPPDPALLASHVCTPIADLGHYVWLSLKFSTFYNRWLLTGQGGPVTLPNGTVVGAAYIFALSAGTDLLHWEPPQLLREKPTFVQNYASLLDEASPTTNFDTLGQHAYFYYTALNMSCAPPGCRDLMRQPVVFAPPASQPG